MLRDGFPSLTDLDEFYEDQCTNTLKLPLVDRLGFPLRYLAYIDFLCNERQRRNRFFRRVAKRLPRKGAVLDLGCGGGMEIWCRLGDVVGVSNSLSGLRHASRIYTACVHADLSRDLPFPEKSFDYIVACDVMAHFDEPGRNRLLAEIHRCLKQEGRLIAVIETIGKWFQHYQQKYPTFGPAYIEASIKRAGHIGLEAPRRALQRLVDRGFVCERLELLGSYPGYVEGYFHLEFEPFPPQSRLQAIAKAISRVVRRNWIATRMTNNIFGIINTINLWVRGVEWADGLMVVCRKTSQ